MLLNSCCPEGKLSNRSAKALRKNFRFFTLSKSTQVELPLLSLVFRWLIKIPLKSSLQSSRPYFSSWIFSIALPTLLLQGWAPIIILHKIWQHFIITLRVHSRERLVRPSPWNTTLQHQYEQQQQQNAFGDFPPYAKGRLHRICKNTFHPQKIFSCCCHFTLMLSRSWESLYMQMLSKHEIPNFIYPSVLLLLAPNCIFSEMMPNVLFYPLLKECFEQGL